MVVSDYLDKTSYNMHTADVSSSPSLKESRAEQTPAPHFDAMIGSLFVNTVINVIRPHDHGHDPTTEQKQTAH